MMKLTYKLWPDIATHSLGVVAFIGLAITLLQLSDPPKIFIWIVLVICAVYIAFSIVYIRSKYFEIKKKEEAIKTFENRDQFFDFIDKERKQSQSSIINIVGDMSWLDQEKEKIQGLISNTHKLSMTFYYDPDAMSSKQEIIKEYQNMGAKMIPYPVSGGAAIKLMLIDIESAESSKMYGIERYNNSQFNGFKVHVFNHDSYPIKIAKEYIRFIPLLNKSIVIGISGINNIGKTTLIREISRQLHNNVFVIDDPWAYIEKPKISTKSNEKRVQDRNLSLACLHKQLFDFLEAFLTNDDKKVIIFDRTPLDNCVFLDHNTDHDFPNIATIRSSTKEFTKYLDMIVLLKPDNNYQYKETTYLSIDERKKIKKSISKRYVEHSNLREYTIAFDEEKFEENISSIAADVIAFIKSKTTHPTHRY